MRGTWSCDSLSIPSQIAKYMGPTWGPPGSFRPQVGPMLAPWTLLSGSISQEPCTQFALCCVLLRFGTRRFYQPSNIWYKTRRIPKLEWFSSRLAIGFAQYLETAVKSKMEMYLEQRWQSMLQLHPSDQQCCCLLRCGLYERFDVISLWCPFHE